MNGALRRMRRAVAARVLRPEERSEEWFRLFSTDDEARAAAIDAVVQAAGQRQPG